MTALATAPLAELLPIGGVRARSSRTDPDAGAPVLDVVIPVHNEEGGLERSVRRLHEHLTQSLPYPFRITIADNASVDRTLMIAETLRAALDDVRVVHLDQKGRVHPRVVTSGTSGQVQLTTRVRSDHSAEVRARTTALIDF